MTILIKIKGKLSGLAVWQAGQDPIGEQGDKRISQKKDSFVAVLRRMGQQRAKGVGDNKYMGEDWSRVDTPGENSRTESD